MKKSDTDMGKTVRPSAQDGWVDYWENPIAGKKELNLPEKYVVLLVLEGEITLTFKAYPDIIIGKQSIVVLGWQSLNSFSWTAGTKVLEFTPPQKMAKFFHSCSKTFSIPCSTVVPMHPELQQWVDELMVARLRPKEELDNDCQRGFCMRLGNILQQYPPLLVGELLIPFQACAMSGEKRCREKCSLIGSS